MNQERSYLTITLPRATSTDERHSCGRSVLPWPLRRCRQVIRSPKTMDHLVHHLRERKPIWYPRKLRVVKQTHFQANLMSTHRMTFYFWDVRKTRFTCVKEMAPHSGFCGYHLRPTNFRIYIYPWWPTMNFAHKRSSLCYYLYYLIYYFKLDLLAYSPLCSYLTMLRHWKLYSTQRNVCPQSLATSLRSSTLRIFPVEVFFGVDAWGWVDYSAMTWLTGNSCTISTHSGHANPGSLVLANSLSCFENSSCRPFQVNVWWGWRTT